MIKAWFRHVACSCALVSICSLGNASVSAQVIGGGHEEDQILTIHAPPGDQPQRPPQPGLVPVSLLLRDYTTWTRAQQLLVPKKKFDEFRAMAPNRQGFCQNAEPTTETIALGHQLFWQTLESQPVALLGKVERADAAWDFMESSPRTILHFRVTRTLKNGGYYPRSVAPGDLLYLVRRDGSFAFNGGIACSRYAPPTTAQAVPGLTTEPIVPGAELLVAGGFSEHNRHYLQTTRVSRFLVHGGKILPPWGDWTEAAPITLADVLARLAP